GAGAGDGVTVSDASQKRNSERFCEASLNGGCRMSTNDLWRRYCQYLCAAPELGLTLDVSRMTFDDGFLARMEPAVQSAYAAMDALEKGAVANPDEKRMVGHYWLRAPELAPTPQIAADVRDTVARVKAFAADVHAGR